MRFLGGVFVLVMGWSTITYAKDNFVSQYVEPIKIRVFSNTKKGPVTQESLHCTPQTCCFSEKFYCFMENGRCICDLHVCNQGIDKKSYWMEISGAEAEKYCGRPRLLHELTTLCICDPNKTPPCDECNPPSNGCSSHVREGLSLPHDCRPH